MNEKQIKIIHEKSGIDLSYISLKSEIQDGEAVTSLKELSKRLKNKKE